MTLRTFVQMAGPLCASVLLLGCSPGFKNAAPQTVLSCDFGKLESNSRRDGPAIVAQAYESVSALPLGAVVVATPALFKTFVVQTISSGPTPGGTVKVSARFVNCVDGVIQFRARTHFLGEGGLPAEQPSSWQSVHLSQGLTSSYEESSFHTSDQVRSFYIEVGPL